MKRKVNLGLVGATGLVGEIFVNLLQERNFPVGEVRLMASERSKGQSRELFGKKIEIVTPSRSAFGGLDLVFFSSGDEISSEWAPLAEGQGAVVVDNSAAFRMDPKRPLIVPEVNGDLLPKQPQPLIIANPNCSTIQLVLALKPLQEAFGVESVHVATYQSVSGAGREAQQELEAQSQAWSRGQDVPSPQILPKVIHHNCIPQIGSFQENGFCSEEIKIMQESKKILRAQDLRISAFTVRIPSWNAHSEAVWVRLKRTVERKDVVNALKRAPGLKVYDSEMKSYPSALDQNGRDDVAIGRIHQDLTDPQTWLFWIVADNLRKGAALNGIQIAERIFDLN